MHKRAGGNRISGAYVNCFPSDVAIRPAGRKDLPASTAASAAFAATAAAAAATLGFGTCLIHIEGSPTDLGAIESSDSLVAFLGVRHLHETKAAGAPGIAVGHDAYAIDLTISLEQPAQLVFTGVEIKVANKNVLQADAPQLSYLSVG